MGTGWTQQSLGNKMNQKDYWSSLLWSLLNNDEMFPFKDVGSLRAPVLAAHGCGYTAFYSLCRVLGHPRLQEGECPTDTPKHNATMSFNKYVRLVQNHIWSAALVGHNYTQAQGIHLALYNLHPKYKMKFLEEKLRLENRSPGFPFDLEFPRLAATFEKWASTFGLDQPGKTSVCKVAAIHTHEENMYSDEDE